MPNPPEHSSTIPARRRPLIFSRRRFLQAFGVTALTGAGTYTYASTLAVHNLVTEHITISISNLPAHREDTRLVVLSDLHAGPRVSIEYLRHLQTAAALNPHFILLPGDLVDSSLTHLDALCEILKPIPAKIPIYASTGNHDFGHRSLAFANKVGDALESAGVHMLRNDFHQPVAGPGELCFVGLEDLWSGYFDPTVLAHTPADASVILLSHNPDTYENVAAFRWQLMLSGHTHGGQVCIPGVGPLLLPVQHRERAAGLFHLDPSQPARSLYVTRGVGHLLKIRFFCPPEITCITLQRA